MSEKVDTRPLPNAGLVAKLEAWAEHDFHADRQLADEILIADGWNCEPDQTFEGGVRWFWGTNPQISSSESTRPHPVNDMNAAIGVVPFKHHWQVLVVGDYAEAEVWAGDRPYHAYRGSAPIPTIALVIASLLAKWGVDHV